MVMSRSPAGTSRINAFEVVVLPVPVLPETTMFLRSCTAKRMNSAYSRRALSASNSFSPGSKLLARVEALGEQAAGGELLQGSHLGARTADRDRDALRQRGRRQDKLHALGGGQRRGENRRDLIHALLGGAAHELREVSTPIEVGEGQVARSTSRHSFG
jgi:hypothetical protein